MINFKVCAVLPAGGTGERMGLSLPKQFHLLDGKHLVCYAVEALESVSWISKVVVVVALERIEVMNAILRSSGYNKTTVVAGGSSRHKSIAAGIRALLDDNPEVIVVHDAVRPLVPVPTLTEVVLAAKKHGAAGAVRPLVSTVVMPDSENFLSQSLDRSKYVASEMPQAFLYKHILAAYEKCTEHDYAYGTECLQLAFKYCGVRAKLIEGPPDLWKVTYRKDMYAFEKLLKENNSCATVAVDGEMDQLLLDRFTSLLSKKVTIIDGNQLHTNEEATFTPTEIILHVGKSLKDVEKWYLKRTLTTGNFTFRSLAVVHVLLCENQKQDLQQSFADVKRLAEKTKEQGKKLYFVCQTESLAFDDRGLHRLVELVSVFITEKHSTLSGQLFVLP